MSNEHKEMTLRLAHIESELLDIVDKRDEFDRSDLQGAVGAQVHLAYLEGRTAGRDAEYDRLKKKALEVLDEPYLSRLF